LELKTSKHQAATVSFFSQSMSAKTKENQLGCLLFDVRQKFLVVVVTNCSEKKSFFICVTF